MGGVCQMGKSYERAEALLAQLSVQQKIGQLVQVSGDGGKVSAALKSKIVQGEVGSVINEVDPATNAELQRLAREEAPHGIPLLIGRDVIHGFKTIMPIPLGMAASWNAPLVEAGAAAAAAEAATQGINWTFSPMLDVSRDPRWGRIAESFGEDPLLTSKFAAAMVRGYQGSAQPGSNQQGTSQDGNNANQQSANQQNGKQQEGNNSSNAKPRLLSCLKHFAGYGASESGKDYNTTNIPETEMRNTYLPPFLAGLEAGAASVMTSFSDLNGRPATANHWLLRQMLRDEWRYKGMVVSDWASIAQLVTHGIAEDAKDAARQAASAGVSMDMASQAYAKHLQALIEEGRLSMALIDALALEVLAVKYEFGLFDQPLQSYAPAIPTQEAADLALQLARESLVLLENKQDILPLAPAKQGKQAKLALIGPLADQPYEQLGTWVFDGDPSLSQSVRQALEERLGDRLLFAPGLTFSRSKDASRFAEALEAAAQADAILLLLGEESILSGEAHCRAHLDLPGIQSQLLEEVRALGKPIITVIMAGRPLVLEAVREASDALLYAFHPGCQAGPALADVLLGDFAPVGKLPVTIPRAVGQVPIYYAHRNTGRPPTPETVAFIDQIAEGTPQVSLGNTAYHLDLDPSPAYPFGHGLSYTRFAYSGLKVQAPMRTGKDALTLQVQVANTGKRAGQETVQLYAQDRVASITRPVKELKAWQRVSLAPGERAQVTFTLAPKDLAFHNGKEYTTEPGLFRFWAGGSSAADLSIETRVLEG